MIRTWKQRLARAAAFWRVRFGHAERICVPGQWVVWREGGNIFSRKIGQ